MVTKTKSLIAGIQRQLREFIQQVNADSGKEYKILVRDYSREQAYNFTRKHVAYINDYRRKEFNELIKEYGPHGFPKTAQEYQRLLYNKDTGQAVHAYVNARKQHTVEPVVSYKDYINAKEQLDQEIVGMATSTGQVIKSYSDHMFDRIFGVRKDPHGKRRIGVSIDQLKEALQSQRHLSSKQRNTETYITNQARVIVNTKGNIVTLVPRKEK